MSNHYYKTYDIVAYSYAADIYCPGCTIEAMIARGVASPGARGMDAETVLWQVLESNGIDSSDETNWDSDEFPKSVMVEHVANDDLCGACGGEIL